MNDPEPPDAIAPLHADVDREVRRLHVLHAARLQCKRGCAACCVDELTVFEVEAERIRSRHTALLGTEAPHARGACAFLDDAGACRIYADRPYVCRTQGLPLRWIEEEDHDRLGAEGSPGVTEFRDICSLNETAEPIEHMTENECWTLGPTEERLARLQLASSAPTARVALRDLFVRKERT